jgi:hypothetical protein
MLAGPFHELGVKVVGGPPGCSFSSKASLYRHAATPHVLSIIEQIDSDIQVRLVVEYQAG